MRVPPAQSDTALLIRAMGDVDVALAQMPRDVGESGAEEERVHSVAIVVIACRKMRSIRA